MYLIRVILGIYNIKRKIHFDLEFFLNDIFNAMQQKYHNKNKSKFLYDTETGGNKHVNIFKNINSYL